MKTTVRLFALRLLPLLLALAPGCTTYRAPQGTTIPVCVDPSRPCQRPADTTYAWIQPTFPVNR